MDDVVRCDDYFLYPLALHLPDSGKWQAMVVITRDQGSRETTLPYSKSFPLEPALFETESEAKEFALQLGHAMVADQDEKLPR